MGMLLHNTWLEQQKKKKPVKAETAPVEEAKAETVSEEPVKRMGGRRKSK